MGSVPKPAHIEIRLDEVRVARGRVDRRTVEVRIKWRGPATDPPVIATLAELPSNLPEPGDLMFAERSDGGLEWFHKSMKTVRFSGATKTFFEQALQTPGGWGPSIVIEEALEYATELIGQYLPDFDSYTEREQASYLLGTIERLIKVSDSLKGLEGYLQYAKPDGRPAVVPIKDPDLPIRATVLRDVHGLGTFKIGENLGIPATESDIRQGKRENQTIRKMIENRGHPLLTYCFGTMEWNAKVRRMQAERARWESLGMKQQFYTLLAEDRGTSLEEEERAAIEDGFDEAVDDLIDALTQGDNERAKRIRLSDRRFRALRRL